MTLREKILIILFLMLTIPIGLSVYHYSTLKKHLINTEIEILRSKAENLTTKFISSINNCKLKVSSLVSLYKSYNFSIDEIIWRITGDLEGIFEGAYYDNNGKLVKTISRETTSPKFPLYWKEKRQEVKFTHYGEPFVRFIVENREGDFTEGFFLFSLDLSILWQNLVVNYFSPSTEIALIDKEGNIYALSSVKIKENLERFYKEESFTQIEKNYLRIFVKKGSWGIYIEKPISEVLKPVEPLKYKILFSGVILTSLGGSLVVILVFRIFKPLEDFKKFLSIWEKTNLGKKVNYKDDIKIITQVFKDLIGKIEEQRKIYNCFFENTLDGVILFEGSGKIINVNKTFCETFKVNKDEILGKKMDDISGRKVSFYPVFVQEEKLILKGKEYLCELKQDILHIEGKPYIVWRVKDKTKEKELQIIMEQTSKLALAGEIACFVAHQINNPLASIIGYAEFLLMQTQDDNFREKLEVIISQARKCSETMRFLLELGKPMGNEAKYVNPVDITLETLRILQPKAKKCQINLEFEGFIGNERIYTFPWQLEQVLINIIDNAIDASPKGSKVKVIVKEQNGYITWEVRDEGKGIPDDELDKIFEPFYSTKENGTGLGLTIAKRMIEGMGGKIDIYRNENGKGTVVIISIPKVIKNENSGS
ncbi:MAG TPA: PAS domain-containing sensor histidine kinase [Aquificaceae bacterium]|nr:PAS domain-containing sensor histidine kinase [Aquificaceae bacterium]HIQ48659.1 PAS domain-containing sensor histidine kinase [Aquifex aeolicus]